MADTGSIEDAGRAVRAFVQDVRPDSEDLPGWRRRWVRVDKLSQEERVVRIFPGTTIRGRDISGQDSQSETFALPGTIEKEDPVHEYLRRARKYFDDVSRCGWGTVESFEDVERPVDHGDLCVPPEGEDGSAMGEAESVGLSPDRLAHELLGLDPVSDWPRLRELILTAEDFDFTPEQSARLAPRLLELAIQYRASNDSQDASVVWSAMRTGASMLRPNGAHRLLALLEPGHPIETSLVALKMLGRIFEAQPPERADQHADLAGEVRGIAESLLNRYAIASSQSAAMAQLAVCTLAAMASSETLLVVQAVRRIGVSWFSQQTARELRELQSSWNARPVSVAPEVLGLLERAVNELRGI